MSEEPKNKPAIHAEIVSELDEAGFKATWPGKLPDEPAGPEVEYPLYVKPKGPYENWTHSQFLVNTKSGWNKWREQHRRG